MTVPHNVFLALFALTAAFVIGGFVFLLLRGERVGTLKLRGRVGVDLSFMSTTGPATHIRLSVAREGGPAPKVQMRTAVPMAMYLEHLDPADAMHLAQVLETASNRLRAP